MAFDILSNSPVCLSCEERLVALRIPFMQIRELGRDRQYGIKGSVTNVPNDFHKSVDCLPRNVNDSATIYVKLKKRLSQSCLQCGFVSNEQAFIPITKR
ncbi:hypothetical protein CDAR_200031 [Caerostris darwini]|uniref:DUF6570 domain-containing protein n=1 Tax=Caerostris darwini TaxID=1538125 RepID=A0AAV4PQ84_9ARAC|nr:hypothetical protein CDAR_200031 [Caerostris darwini]